MPHTLQIFTDMKQTLFTTAFALLTCLTGLKAQDTAQPSGEGTTANPYLIGSAAELRWFADFVNTTDADGTYPNSAASASLTADIDLNPGFTFNADGTYSGPDGAEPEAWEPIMGNSYNATKTKYSGFFDGQGHSVSGVYIPEGETSYIGLFGIVGSTSYNYTNGGSIRNLTIRNAYMAQTSSRNGNMGGICGALNYGSVENCRSEAYLVVKDGGGETGGICGMTGYSCLIKNSNNAGSITNATTDNVTIGGICGLIGNSSSVTIENCANSATLILADDGLNAWGCAGGIIGENPQRGSSTLRNCYNTGAIVGETSTKQTLGLLYGSNEGTAKVYNSYYLPQESLPIIGDGTSPTTAEATSKTAEEFASGSVAYLLGEAWGQDLSEDSKDEFPVMRNEENQVFLVTVYPGSATATKAYINKEGLQLEGNALAFTADEELGAATNVVVGSGGESAAYVCQNLVLTDGEPFFTPRDFTAVRATYSRTPTRYADGEKGWETIVVPFDGALLADGEEQAYFTSDADNSARYWLKTFSGQSAGATLGFDYEQPDASTSRPLLRAGKPYIIALPGEATWPGYGFDGKEITIEGENTTVTATLNPVSGTEYTFLGSYDGQAPSAATFYTLDGEGRNFSQGGTVAPFRACLAAAPEVLNAPRTLGIGSGTDGTTGMNNLKADGSLSLTPGAGCLTVRTTRATAVSVTSLQGYTLWSGTVDGTQRIDLPAAGCYLVNGGKVIVTQP